jgi:hypothetical protein
MERFEGPADLVWVANSSLDFTAEVHVEVTALESGWSARLIDPSEDVRWITTILDNPFELRFSDGSTFAVGVSGPDDEALILWDWEEEGDRPQPCPVCGSAMTYAGFTIDLTGRQPDAPEFHCPQCDNDHKILPPGANPQKN